LELLQSISDDPDFIMLHLRKKSTYADASLAHARQLEREREKLNADHQAAIAALRGPQLEKPVYSPRKKWLLSHPPR
jgi:hypothetical protein